MCFPSSAFVAHVLRSAWLTFHLLQVPLLLAVCWPRLAASSCQKEKKKRSPATWNYRTFKAGTSCPSEIHSAYHKAKPALSEQEDAGRDVFLLSASDRLFIGPRQAAPIVWIKSQQRRFLLPSFRPPVRCPSSDEASWKHRDKRRESKFGRSGGLPTPESHDEDFFLDHTLRGE